MKILLDTHSLIWYALDDPRLSVTARTLIEDPDNEIPFSPVSSWEIAIKVSIGKLALHRPYKDFLDLCLGPHGFSFDRLLIAQAIVEDIPILSVDAALDAYPVRRIW